MRQRTFRKKTLRPKSPHKKASLLLILALVLIGALFYGLGLREKPQESSAKERVSATRPYPRPYSDAQITEHATESNPRLSGGEQLGAERLMASVFASFARSEKSGDAVAPEKENGAWLWTPLLSMTPGYRTSVLDGAQLNGIRAIYLSIDSYLDIFVLQEGPEKEKEKRRFDAALEKLIGEARERGMSVDAEGGWRNWGEKGHTYKAFAVLDYAIEFNRTHAEKLRGFQYDVEPYLLDEYQTRKRVVLRDFLALVNASVSRLNGSNLALSVVIPEFYDGAGGETPSFFYAWGWGHAFDHLLRVMDRRPGSSVIVMSYRNFAGGEDGALAISQDEIERANRRQTRVVIAQETGDFPPPYITFHNVSRAAYEKQREAITAAFAGEKSYGGLATHYINALMELK